MLRYLIRRIGVFLPTLLAASFLIFVFIRLIPGDPAAIMLGDQATPGEVAALRAAMGLEDSLASQYVRWLSAVVRGDLGDSIFFQVSVLELITDGLETSILLALITMVWIIVLGLPIGMLAAARRGSWLDQGLSGTTMFLASVPTFWVGLYLILIFAAMLKWLPSSGYPSIFGEGGIANLRYLLLPSIALAAPNAALIIRLTRASMLEVYHEDYVRTARAKGMHPVRVVVRHIFRNAVLTVVSAIGFTIAALISEAVVTETVFALPGVGRMVVQSILRRDYPVIQGTILMIVLLYLVINLVVDILYAWLDPRVQLQMIRVAARIGLGGRKLAFAGLVIVAALAVCALFAPWLAPADPIAIDPPARLSPPGAGHWFGTDHFGRDTLSRVIHGSRMAMLIGIGVVAIALGGGVTFGVLSALFPRLGMLLMRIVDVLMAFPALLLALALIVVLGRGVENSILAIGVVYMTTTSRLVYGVSLRLKAATWVDAALAMGAGTGRIIFRHILPNLMSPLLVQASFVFAFAQLQAASLDFLGLGVPPETPTWGNMLSESRVYITRAPWLLLFPGLMIALSAFSLNLVGDAVRDRLDPRLRAAFASRTRS